MELARVKEVLAILADGVDPVTGEIFPPDSPYQNPDVIRALFTALKYLEAADGKPPARKPLPGNAGAAWTADQEEELAAAFNGGATVKEIAAEMGRTNGAIKSRLQKIGLLPL